MFAGAAAAQQETADRVIVELTDPGKPVFLSAGLINGGITVVGYDGKDVIVEAKAGMVKLDKHDRKGGKYEGMTRLPVSSSSLTVEEQDNRIDIDTDSWAHPVDLMIRVPNKAFLNLSCINSGDIKVENITGDIEASNINGAVTLLKISGSVVASAHNKDLTVTFDAINPEKDMSFSSFNGDVDITFPAPLKALVKIKTVQGDIFTDFEVKEIKNPEQVIQKNKRDSDGKYRVEIDRSFWGTINGGGQELHFSNYNGDIYIREK
ncbi:MAG: DUF4097 domain-containing protein [Candidatus Eisenbacteria bacterium]|uniref:DUF4097 domain-containing protein n=1 Tax=Eiseniibacteriota bacterium TaxID=2212470 RepID=A0A948W8I1_UNCEI|nr:DUF4097 domain-containing protein [Candidatus Eisenbacteria bacterium]MBU1947196.1 DUF4097 domain-containing protein [Candidatus Eisenbacteria bacterium]MBU2693355.1 DUF4097 domain-containing protein [Candidatus Eisenbacteria bacterium]